MVGRLVEQQKVRLLQQEFSQRDAHLPAAGKFFRTSLPVMLAEAEAHQHCADLRLDGVTIAGAELVV